MKKSKYKKLFLFLWYAYLYILIIFIIHKGVELFVPSQPHSIYYSILLSFDSTFLLSYFLNVSQIIVNALHLYPVFCYISNRPLPHLTVWRYLFILRILFDITGHSLEISQLMAIYHADHAIFWLVLLQSISTYVPSYMACFRIIVQNKSLYEK